MVTTVYREHTKQMGSASNAYVYLSKVPVGKILKVEHLAAAIYTTNPGDYTTAKFIWVGFELGGNYYYLNGHDVQPASGMNKATVFVKNFTIPEGARLFAYFEATATTEEYEVAATGIFCDVSTPK